MEGYLPDFYARGRFMKYSMSVSLMSQLIKFFFAVVVVVDVVV